MRNRDEILKDVAPHAFGRTSFNQSTKAEAVILETLLDIRDLLTKQEIDPNPYPSHLIEQKEK